MHVYKIDIESDSLFQSTMVKLHVKHGDESQFLYETTTNIPIDDLIHQISLIYNGRLKVHRICNGNQCIHSFHLKPSSFLSRNVHVSQTWHNTTREYAGFNG